jgi:acyl carrier protein
MEIADCGDIKHELRALELLGKHSDIGLFTERSEITINYKTPESLENAIKERIKRLLNADIIDVTPIGMDLDEELGVYVPPGEFEEVEDAQFEELTEEGEEFNP